MKLEELHLKAFGPFTDLRLDLGAGQEGLHVIYGPNEAGKSSALRALVDLLFEIPKQTSDAFLHPYGSLRIGGTLRPRSGEPLRVVRRKGVKGTLLSADDEQPLPDDALAPVLRGVDRAFFTTFFGIDQPTLSHGGEQILVQGGAVGQALFSAALPAGDLSATLAELEDEAGELFKRNASKPSINRAVAEFREAKRVIKDSSLTSAEWQERSQALAQARSELRETSEQLDELLAAEHRLVRHGRVIPLLAARREVVASLEALAGAPRLPADFGDRRQRAQGTRRAAQETIRKAGAKLERLRDEARALRVPRQLLDEAEAIESLHQRLGSFMKAQADRPGLVNRAEACRREAETLARTLWPGLALEGSRATARQADEPREANATTVGAAVASLRSALAWARAAGDLDRAVDDAERELRRRSEDAELALRQLPLFSGTLDELERLALPPRDAIARFDAAFADLRVQQREVDGALQAARRSLRETEAKLEELLAAGGEVPSEDALKQARAARDEAWAAVKAQWLEGGAGDAGSTAAAFERASRTADDLADRLRREADRVQRHASLVARRDELHNEAALVASDASSLREGLAVQQQAWSKLWAECRLTPLAPREMLAWSTAWDRVREKAAAVREARALLADVRARRRERRETLARELASNGAALGDAGDSLGPLVSRAEELVASMEKASTALGQAQELEQRIAVIDRDAEAFADTVRSFVERLAAPLAGLEPAQAATRLNAMLTEARRAATELQKLTTQVKDREEEIAEAEASLAVASQQLGELLRLAGVASEDELPAAEERAARRLRAEEDLERIEAQLRVEGEGSPVERLAEEAAGVDVAAIQEQLQELRVRIAALKERRDQLFETKGRREADLARMDGNARAAEAADRAQEILAALRRDVERYMRLRLASTILRAQIERFRADNQHALLRRGGELFSRLTLGSFAELQTDLGDQGEPVIVGARPGGKKLGVSAMSSGTRDQLYLALRLASLERFLASSPEPLPFVVDDILVNFDDDRSAATLEVLADLSRATQVILFTHHRRVRELADRLGTGSQVFVHELSRSSGTIA